MISVGLDIGGRSHALARCREGNPRADRDVLRVGQSRAGFEALDTWLTRQPEPITSVTLDRRLGQ